MHHSVLSVVSQCCHIRRAFCYRKQISFGRIAHPKVNQNRKFVYVKRLFRNFWRHWISLVSFQLVRQQGGCFNQNEMTRKLNLALAAVKLAGRSNFLSGTPYGLFSSSKIIQSTSEISERERQRSTWSRRPTSPTSPRRPRPRRTSPSSTSSRPSERPASSSRTTTNQESSSSRKEVSMNAKFRERR